jgi:hypothetical protein
MAFTDVFSLCRKGALTEIFGGRSSGKTGLIFSILGIATARQEYCAIVDATDSFDPLSAQNAGVGLNQVLWVCCSGNLDSALKSTDHLINAGGFKYVLLDLTDVRPDIVYRIPYSYWFRFRLAAEKTQTAFLLVTPVPCSGSGSSVLLECSQVKAEWIGSPYYRLLTAILSVNLLRKNPRPAHMLKAKSRVGNMPPKLENTASSF